MKSQANNTEDQRIQEILNLIYELASGNLETRGTVSENDDNLDGIIAGLNLLAEEIAQDISERRQAEEVLKESEEKFSRAFHSNPHPMSIVTLEEGRYRDVNDSYVQTFGFSLEELLGRTSVEMGILKNDRARRKILQSLKERQAVKSLELELYTRSGRKVEALLSGDKVEIGSQTCLLSVITDITERKQIEEALGKSEFILAEAQRLAYIGSWEYDLTSNTPTWSDEVYRIFGLELKEIEATYEAYVDHIHPDDREMVIKAYNESVSNRTPYNIVHRLLQKDGCVKYVNERCETFYDDDGKPIRSIGTIQDITERNQAEEAIKQSEENLKAYLESAPDAIYINDLKGTFLYGNKKAEEIMGYKREELIGKSFLKLKIIPGKYLAKTGKLLALNVMGKPTGPDEFEMIRKDGSHVWVEINTTPIKQQESTVVIGFVRDITERKQADEEVRGLAKFPSQNPNPVLRVAKDGTIIYANEASLTLLNVWGSQIGKLLPDYWRKLVLDALSSGSTKDAEINCGNRVLSLTFAPVAEMGYVNLYGLDITERKRAEEKEKQLQQELIAASRLATVGEMAAGIAHEINNPLTGVVGFSDLLMEKELPEDIRKDVEAIYDGAQRIAGITSRMLAYARQSKPEQTMVDINDIIKTTLDMRTYEMESSNIKVTPQLDSDLPVTMADAGQLQQVFLNIILNAETEMINAHGKGNLSVKTERIDNAIRVSFEDDGPGISKENLDKIFNPFFTTREVGKGAGLGLSVSHGIVHQHGGKIYAKSRLGKGATFFVELPVVTKEEQLKLAEPVIQPGKVAKARILVVDDDAIVQQFISEILTKEGHEVEIVDNGNDAIERLESEDYDVILLDIKLPGMSGIDLYKHLQKTAKSLARKVLFITGDTMSTDTMSFLSRVKPAYVTKPINNEQLKKEMGHILGQHK